MKGYHDRNGVELNAGDYIRLNEYAQPQMLYEWEDEYGNKGLGTDATNPAWIKSGRAVPCEFGIYNLNSEDMKYCEVCGKDPIPLPEKQTTLKYYRRLHDRDTWEEITYEKALHIVLGTYKDNDVTRDMLQTANWIGCRWSTVKVTSITEDGHEMVRMPGLYNMTPDGYEYDDDGNRI